MDIVVLVGRILFSALFLASALGHLTQTAAMAGYAESRAVPSPRIATQVTGVVILVGALSVLLGVWPDAGALLLVVFLVSTAVLMHNFWSEEGEARMQLQVQFMKDVALAGAALALFAFFAESDGSLGLTLTGPLF